MEGVQAGSNLLLVGDNAGVNLPRACRTGLCGSCTCEVKDPQAIATNTNPRDGFATLRACSTKCFVPDGLDEMVVDVYRLQGKAPRAARAEGADIMEKTNPTARFSGNWELDFKPNWELARDNQVAVDEPFNLKIMVRR